MKNSRSFEVSFVVFTTLHPNQIYKMYIRPHLDYCDIIYCHIPATANQFFSLITLHPLMESIERIQY